VDLTIDWVHPSVRDVAINYLMSHDAERRQFLLTALSPGIVLALSTAGGVRGERAFPLARTTADWAAIERRVEELLRGASPDDQLALMRGLLSPLTEPSLGSSERSRLGHLVALSLDTIAADWDTREAALPRAALATFFELSSQARVHTRCPRLDPSWDKLATAATVAAQRGRVDKVTNAYEWLRLAQLLLDNEPRFLRAVGWPIEHYGILEKWRELIAARVDAMWDLDEDETEEYEVHDGQWATLPVEPSSEEEEERGWLEVADDFLRLARSLALFSPVEVEDTHQAVEEHLSARQTRHERWEEEGPRDGEPDYDRDAVRSPPGSDFDIDAFFSDL
jgi:hypothetical protein